MSILVQSPHSPIHNLVPAYIAPGPKFLLSPPPPPKQKRATVKPPTPPHSRRTHNLPFPRTPLSPRESFLNILETPAPTSLSKTRAPGPLLFNELGYNVAIEAFYAPKPSSIAVTPRPTAAKFADNSSSATEVVAPGMNVLSRQHTNTSTSLKSSSASKGMMPLYVRSNNSYEKSSPLCPPMPEYTQQRRGSLPTSSSQNRPRSSTKSSSRVEKDINKAHKKRYPLPLPYGAVVEMDQILGDMRSAQNVRMPYAASSAHSRGATPVGPNGQISTGRPYVGADGRIWRDREEELEYTGLLANGDTYRRGSDDTTTSLDDDKEERYGRRAWAKFGANNSRQGTMTHDGHHASEQRPRLPHGATASFDDEDEDGRAWSPLVSTHAQHQFPNYVFPTPSESSRASSSTTAATAGGRAIPLPASINDFAVPGGNTKAPNVQHVPKAKEDFLASAFAPIPQPNAYNSRRPDRERATRPPTSMTPQYQESRMTARRSSVQGVGHNEIVVPLPSLRPSHHQLHAPSLNTSLRGDSEKGPSKSGFLGVFKKKS